MPVVALAVARLAGFDRVEERVARRHALPLPRVLRGRRSQRDVRLAPRSEARRPSRRHPSARPSPRPHRPRPRGRGSAWAPSGPARCRGRRSRRRCAASSDLPRPTRWHARSHRCRRRRRRPTGGAAARRAPPPGCATGRRRRRHEPRLAQCLQTFVEHVARRAARQPRRVPRSRASATRRGVTRRRPRPPGSSGGWRREQRSP